MKQAYSVIQMAGAVLLLVGAVLLVFAGVLMFVTRHNEWVLCLTVAAILQLYTAFRIPAELEKEK